MMWPFKPPQKVPLQQEFVASDVPGVYSFSVNGNHPEDRTHVPAVGEEDVPGSSLCLQRSCVGLQVVSLC